MVLSTEEIKGALFSLNKIGALEPDGFDAFLFQHYWDVVQQDMVRVVM